MGSSCNGFSSQCLSFMDALRIHHFQYVGVAVVATFTVFTSSALFPSRQRADHASFTDSSSFKDPAHYSQYDILLHLTSLAANFGAQLWVLFIAGLIMFYSLPRHMFGQVQSRLFPMFYLWCLTCSSLTLYYWLKIHPPSTWSASDVIQVCVLTFSFLASAVNSLLVSPVIVAAMIATFRMEVEAGVKDVIGHVDMTQLKDNARYVASYRMFRRFHGISAMLVTASLVANFVQLYYIARDCAPS